MMKARIFLAALLTLASAACDSDFSESIDRDDNGVASAFDRPVAVDSQLVIYPPGDEDFVDAVSDTPTVFEVTQLEADRIVVETYRDGRATLIFTTDGSPSPNERVSFDVVVPEEIDWDYIGPNWVASTADFHVEYDVLYDDERLKGIGFKAVTLAEGLAVHETPRDIDEARRLYDRYLQVSAGEPGDYVLETSLGEDIELHRITGNEVERVEISGPLTLGAQEEEGYNVSGWFDEKVVLGFDEFSAKSKTPFICTISDRSERNTYFRFEVKTKSKPGTCVVKLKSKQGDWEREHEITVQ